jgi:membrane-associated phospholipid phosphatase
VGAVNLSIAQRLVVGAAMLVVSLGYLPLNRLMTDGVTVEIWLDSYVPLWPIWIVPYLMTLAWWIVAGIWALWSMDDEMYVAFVCSWIVACVIGFSVFILYPTYMVRPELTGDGWAEQVVRYVYNNDRTYNAFPSMHVWATVTISLYWSLWKPKWRGWLVAATIVVALSTVLSGQHWIMDVVGGTILAVVCFPLGRRLAAPVLAAMRQSAAARTGGSAMDGETA